MNLYNHIHPVLAIYKEEIHTVPKMFPRGKIKGQLLPVKAQSPSSSQALQCLSCCPQKHFPSHECSHTRQPTPLHGMSKLLCSAHSCNKTSLGVSTRKTAQPTSLLNRRTLQQLPLAGLPIPDCLFHLVQLGCAIPEHTCPAGLSWPVSNENMQCLIGRIAPRSA